MAKPLNNTIKLHRDSGITITVKDGKGDVTRIITIDSTATTTTVKDKKNTSKITQKPDSIVIDCPAGEVKITSKKFTVITTEDTSITADKKVTITSSQDMTLTSKTKMTQKSTQAFSISGSDVDIKGNNKVGITGANTTISGNSKVEIKGGAVDVNSNGGLNMNGASVKMAAKSTLSAEGQSTTLKGQMVKIDSPSVQLVGPQVKIAC